MPRFVHEKKLPFDVGRVWDWHLRPGALERLMPPWEDLRVVGRKGGVDDGGTVHVRARRGPLKVDFKVRHTDFEAGRLFTDEQISGPMGSWVHRHEFEPLKGGAAASSATGSPTIRHSERPPPRWRGPLSKPK